jgi:hypothetical protein
VYFDSNDELIDWEQELLKAASIESGAQLGVKK